MSDGVCVCVCVYVCVYFMRDFYCVQVKIMDSVTIQPHPIFGKSVIFYLCVCVCEGVCVYVVVFYA